MKERTQSFTELINRRVMELAQDEPEKWNRHSDIAHQVGLAFGRYYHPWKVTRLLRGDRGLLDPPEVAAWVRATGLDRDPVTEVEAWHAAGLWHPDLDPPSVVSLLAARRAPVEASPTGEPGEAAESDSFPWNTRYAGQRIVRLPRNRTLVRPALMAA